MSKTCTIDACENPVRARGWCAKHYARWASHGDPQGGGTPRGELVRFYDEVVLKHSSSDECLLWPYGHTARGYALMHVCGIQSLVHRLACQAVHGAAPSPDHQAAHRCGNGHRGCVNPRHVRWATPYENSQDKILHGTSNRGERHGMSKLTSDQVEAIRALKGTRSQSEIGAMYGVSQTLIGLIHRGVIWGHTALQDGMTPDELEMTPSEEDEDFE